MSRFMIVDRGEELNDATARALRSAASPVLLRLLETAPPFREDQIVHVNPVGSGRAASRDILLVRGDGAYRLWLPGAGGPPGEVLARVTAISRGPTTFVLERGVLGRLPRRLAIAAIDTLEVFARLRHPLTPPLFQGNAEESLARLREKYGRAAEVRAFSRSAELGPDPLELDMVRRHVRPGGRLLDVGCGAGREALGFARAGFQVVGIDIAPAMVDAARRNAERRGLAVEFRVQSATDLAEPAASYDGVYFAGCFQHVPGRALRIDTLRRLGRTLTPEGALILVVVYRRRHGLLSRSRLVDGLRALGGLVPGPRRFSESGDAYMRDLSCTSDPRQPVFFHDFAGPDDLRPELEAAGLSAWEELPGWWVCRPASALPPPGASATV